MIIISSVILAVLIIALGVWYFRAGTSTNNITSDNDTSAVKTPTFEEQKTEQLEFAQRVYSQYKTAGGNMSSGPCLSNGTEWVVDVVNNPRQAVDDLPANQCPSYLSGLSKHFIELDLSGNLVRAQ